MISSMSRLYICVTPFFPSPENWRGAYVLDQVKAIKRNSDYEVVVFTPCKLSERHSSYEFEGFTVHSVPAWFMPSYFFNGFGGELNGRNFIKVLRNIGIKPEDIDVLHGHTAAFACFASSVKRYSPKAKTVIQYHDLDPYQVRLGKFATWRPNVTYRVKKFVSHFKNIDLHLCISQRTQYNLLHFPIPHPQEQYQPYLSILEAAGHLSLSNNELNSYVLYNGVDTSVFYKMDGVKDNSVFRIGCVSNFNELKDHVTLIRAIELLVRERPEIRLEVSFVGSGETMDSCKEYINSHGLERYFVFEREMPHEKLAEYYNSLNLFVLPSCFEGFGCVYTEAAACGVPFIGCTNQGYSEYIADKDKDLWLIEPHDYTKLSSLISRQILEPIEQTLKYSYSIDSLVSDYLKYLSTL